MWQRTEGCEEAPAEAIREKLKEIKPDALIISDPGILAVVKKTWPKIDIHLSCTPEQCIGNGG